MFGSSAATIGNDPDLQIALDFITVLVYVRAVYKKLQIPAALTIKVVKERVGDVAN